MPKKKGTSRLTVDLDPQDKELIEGLAISHGKSQSAVCRDGVRLLARVRSEAQQGRRIGFFGGDTDSSNPQGPIELLTLL